MQVVTKKAAQNATKLSKLEEKWSSPLMEAGWTVIPSVILVRQRALELDPVDINILLHLIFYWWDPERFPYPAKRTIAECIGRSTSTVQRRIAAMEEAGYLKRIPRHHPKYGQQTNTYDLSGLIRAATPLAEEAIADRARRREEKSAVRKRKHLKIARTASPDEGE